MMRTLLLFMAAISTTPLTAQEKTPRIGFKVENFTLKDYRGKDYSLDDFKDKKLVVLAFLGTECPLAKQYAPRLVKLAETFRPRGVAVIGLNANSQDSVTEIAAYARVHDVSFPLLKDLENRIADRLGATRTPEVFVLDSERVVRYRGRIDDQYGIGYVRDKPARADLSIALQELLAGKKVSKAITQPAGCFIGRVRQPKSGATVTYSNQVARVFQKRCVECHRKGDIAPFALTSYKEAAGWAEMIAEVVEQERMPPWHASPKYGRFTNDRRLTDEEKRLLLTWAAEGAPEGDPKDQPAPRTFPTEWHLPRKPDQVIPVSPKPFKVPPEGAVRYQYFQTNPGFKEDKWVTAAEIMPGNRAVVHHLLAFAVPPGGLRSFTERRDLGYLVAYVAGKRSEPFPEGMAKRIPAGSTLLFQVHYQTIGSPQEDQSKLGLIFTDPREVRYEVKTSMVAQKSLRILPRLDNQRVEATTRPLRECLLLGFMPHMHLRGKSFRFELLYPTTGKREILLDVPRYDFNWQTDYRLTEPRRLPPAARIHGIAHFDNSENNLNNPDPRKTVAWGDQAWHEMMIGYFDIAVPVRPMRK